jgi:hypothetical protein
MGAIIIGGLLSSPFLTLLVVPAAYSIMASIGGIVGRLAGWFGRGKKKKRKLKAA